MTDEFQIGDPIIFMKVGIHAGEELEAIIERKRAEIESAGFAMWGYGGNTCHPRTMVRPFAAAHASEPIRLVMQEVKSNHFADQVRADEFSVDGEKWETIPSSINVMGSRFALCVKNLATVSAELPLGGTEVAVGLSKGKSGSAYVKGRVDKACLEVVAGGDDRPPVPISLVADLVDPFAVLLR